MRLRVRAMLQAQQQWNVELENQVRAKTSALEQLVENRDQLLGQTITAQEDERRRVARELHDETSQALTALIANLAIVQRDPELATTTATQLKAIRQTAVELLQGVNRIVFDLRPTLLDDYGLIAALSWYAENRLTPNEMRVQIETFGDVVRLPPTVETILFRVGQEALTNIAKYARAQHVLINFLFENGATPPGITLQIQDDGIGFDIDQKLQRSPTDRPSFGLLGMYERINLVGGQIEVRSKPGGGTTICVTVPLPTLSASKGADA
jgi:signal transduction histidine kinase